MKIILQVNVELKYHTTTKVETIMAYTPKVILFKYFLK